jgi:hypothetical protein
MELDKPKLIEDKINHKKQPLTVEILKTILNKEISDEEAQEIVFAIRQFVSIIVDYQYEQELKEKYKNENHFKQAA